MYLRAPQRDVVSTDHFVLDGHLHYFFLRNIQFVTWSTIMFQSDHGFVILHGDSPYAQKFENLNRFT